MELILPLSLFVANYSDSYYGEDTYGLPDAGQKVASSTHSFTWIILISAVCILAAIAIAYIVSRRRRNKRPQTQTDDIVYPQH